LGGGGVWPKPRKKGHREGLITQRLLRGSSLKLEVRTGLHVTRGEKKDLNCRVRGHTTDVPLLIITLRSLTRGGRRRVFKRKGSKWTIWAVMVEEKVPIWMIVLGTKKTLLKIYIDHQERKRRDTKRMFKWNQCRDNNIDTLADT